MRTLVDILLRNRVMVLVLLVAYTMAGSLAYFRLPIEAYPDVTNIQVQVITLWDGHAAEEVEKFVTIPIENQLNALSKRATLRSISIFGLSVVTVVFEDDADNYESRSRVAQQIGGVTLPQGATANLSSDSTPVGEIFRYTLQSDGGYPLMELRALEDWVVERQFRTVPGVVDVVGFGGPTKQYQAIVDPLKLKSYSLNLKQVTDALGASNQNAGGAYVERGSQMFIVRGLGLIENLDDIRHTVLAVRNNTPITVGDVAQVEIGNRLRLGRVGLNSCAPDGTGRFDQDDVVQGIVIMRKGENALEVLGRVRAKAQEINRTYLPPGVRLVPHYDRTELIDRTLHTVRENTLAGIGLVVGVLILFLGLRNIRSALIVASVIPFALLGAFMLLDLRHVPANLISLGAVDFGIIVDSAVVIIENIIHLIEDRQRNGLSIRQAIVEGTASMAKPILFSKLVLLVAFIPLFTMQRVEGRIFRPMALTLTFAIVVGTALAIFVVPCFASYFLKQPPPHAPDDTRVGFGLVQFLRRFYRPLLDYALSHGRKVLLVAGAAFVLTLLIGSRLGSEFLPKLEEGALWLRVRMPESIAPLEATRIVKDVRKTIAQFPEVKTIVSQLGRPDDGTDVGGFSNGEFFVDLIAIDRWKTARDRPGLVAMMSIALDSFPGIDYEFSQVIEDNVNEAVSGIKGELGIKIFGADPDRLQALADQVTRLVQNVPGASNVSAEHLAGQPQIQAQVNRRAVARYGLGMADVGQLIETAFGGKVVTQVIEGERSFDLAVKLRPDATRSLEQIRSIPLFGSSGEMLVLGAVAEVVPSGGFGRIYRENNERRIAVKFEVQGRDLGSVIADAQRAVAEKVKLPTGYRLEWSGSFENQQRALARLMIVVPITLATIFFILFSAFGRVPHAAIILLNVPLAAVGGVIGLWLARLPLSVSALVGFVALFGASVQNGVILLERICEVLDSGAEKLAAIREAALSRLRPVLMTSSMAALGLLPAALSHAVGAETARPFATVIVAGLASSTVLTLIVLPVVCLLFLPATTRIPAQPTPPAQADDSMWKAIH